MNQETTVKVGKRLVEAHLDVRTFKREFRNNFNLVESFFNSLIIVEQGEWDDEEIRNCILAETEWLPFFIKLADSNDETVIFIVAGVKYENIPEISSGTRTERFNEFKMPVDYISKKDDVIVLNSLLADNTCFAHNFLTNRTVNFMDKNWIVKKDKL